MRTFYLHDNISHWCPEKDDTGVIKENKVKKTMQQRYLQLSMNELYAQFFEEHPKVAIGKTKFQSLNPQHVLYSLRTPGNLCLCTINENMQLLFGSANGHSKKVNVQIPLYNRDILNELVSQPPSYAIFAKMDSSLSKIMPCWKLCMMTQIMSKILMVIQGPTLMKMMKIPPAKCDIKSHNRKRVANPNGKGEHMVKVASFRILASL